jgi:hypothetical protein
MAWMAASCPSMGMAAGCTSIGMACCSIVGMADLLYGGGGSSAQPEPCIGEEIE